MTSVRESLTPAQAPKMPLAKIVVANWNDHQWEVIGAGLSTVALSAGAIALNVLSGPLSAIAGIAIAALGALVIFLKSVFAQPRVTQVISPQLPTSLTPSAPEKNQTSNSNLFKQYAPLVGKWLAAAGLGYAAYKGYQRYTAEPNMCPVVKPESLGASIRSSMLPSKCEPKDQATASFLTLGKQPTTHAAFQKLSALSPQAVSRAKMDTLSQLKVPQFVNASNEASLYGECPALCTPNEKPADILPIAGPSAVDSPSFTQKTVEALLRDGKPEPISDLSYLNVLRGMNVASHKTQVAAAPKPVAKDETVYVDVSKLRPADGQCPAVCTPEERPVNVSSQAQEDHKQMLEYYLTQFRALRA